jgi:hypothetical protein
MGHNALASRLESMHLLARKERDLLVSDLADILSGSHRRVVFDVMGINTLNQFFMPSPRDYDDNSEYQRARENSVRFFQNLGLFEVSVEGRLIDYNHLHRPLTKSDTYYSKAESGPAVIDA